MAIIEWEERYSVGSSVMDGHHKQLFDIYNRLYTEISKGQGINVVQGSLNELVDYTKYHFAEEEKMLASVNYPDLEMHKGLHKKFISDLENVRHDIANGMEYIALIKLLSSTRSWLQEHILQIDAGYSHLVKAYS